MPYQLGVDLGTTYTAAAIRRSGADEPEVVPLGTRSVPVPSVVLVAEDGSLVGGEAAERHAQTEPNRLWRGFKRRVGDGAPYVVGGKPVSAQTLAARLVRGTVDLVAEQEGEAASAVAVTCPAGWSGRQRDLFSDALAASGLAEAVLVAGPQAAALGYAGEQRIQPGETVAVYDLGGGMFDAAMVRKTAEGGFELLAPPEGLEHLGGEDFDAAVFAHVTAEAGDGFDVADPELPAALARLRRECSVAKEALSVGTAVTIPVTVPGVATQVRLERAEFEEMIRPAVAETVGLLGRAVTSAGLVATDLSAVLLMGGSSRVPLVAELVSGHFGCPVVVDADPKTPAALGAAIAAGQGVPVESPAAVVADSSPAEPPSGAPSTALVPVSAPPEAQPDPAPRPPEPAPRLPELVGYPPPGGADPPSAPTEEFPPVIAGRGPTRSRQVRTAALAGAASLVIAGGVALLAGAPIDGTEPPAPGNVIAGAAPPGAAADGYNGSLAAGAAIDPWTGQPEALTTPPGLLRAGDGPPSEPSTGEMLSQAVRGTVPGNDRSASGGVSGGGSKADDRVYSGDPTDGDPTGGGSGTGGSTPPTTPPTTPTTTQPTTPTTTPPSTPTTTPPSTPTTTPPSTPTTTPPGQSGASS